MWKMHWKSRGMILWVCWKAFAKDIFSADSSGHDYHHTLRVWALARTIGEAEGVDLTLV